MSEAKYIEFVKQARPINCKTDAWVVWPKGERDPEKALGLVEWFTRWRKVERSCKADPTPL